MATDGRLRLAGAERYTYHEADLIRLGREVTPDENGKLQTQAESLRRRVKWQGLTLENPLPSGLSVREGTTLSDAAMFAELGQARRDSSSITDDSSIRSRVNLHLACIALCFSEHDLAKRYLEDIAPWTSDPCLLYLAHFLHGRVNQEDGRHEEAEMSYRAALQVIPRAQSASTALAALLAQRGRVADAASLIDDSLSGESSIPDPWIVGLGRGGCSEWPSLLAGLQAGLR